jgi:Mg-chelatase subunit ChlD
MNFEEEEEMKDSEIDSIFAEPKLNEYIFVIDRSGSMFGQPM